MEGLSWLSQWEGEIPDNLPIKVLASRDDQIVLRKMTLDIWRKHSIKWVDDGGHMLPITQSDWCTEHIKEFLNDNA
jgi:pimeloyl-[acyl-carrier protein] methyl ester esterase